MQLTALQSLLLNTDTTTDVLRDLARVAAEAVHPSASCGITSRRDGQPITVASSDQRAEQLDETQYRAEDGPCLHALDTGQPIEITDLTDDHRWPQYREHALASGVRSSLSLPLTAAGNPIGALNLYLYDRHTLTDAQRRRAELLAAQTTAMLRLTFEQAEQAGLTRQLAETLTDRSAVDRAIGVVVAQEHCSPEQAKARLHARAADNSQSLAQAAADTVAATRQRPSPS